MSTPEVNLDGDEEAKSDFDKFVAEQAADFGCTPEEIIQLIHEAFLRENCGEGDLEVTMSHLEPKTETRPPHWPFDLN